MLFPVELLNSSLVTMTTQMAGTTARQTRTGMLETKSTKQSNSSVSPTTLTSPPPPPPSLFSLPTSILSHLRLLSQHPSEFSFIIPLPPPSSPQHAHEWRRLGIHWNPSPRQGHPQTVCFFLSNRSPTARFLCHHILTRSHINAQKQRRATGHRYQQLTLLCLLRWSGRLIAVLINSLSPHSPAYISSMKQILLISLTAKPYLQHHFIFTILHPPTTFLLVKIWFWYRIIRTIQQESLSQGGATYIDEKHLTQRPCSTLRLEPVQ
ncbi:hypothetical protein F4861DRAFT_464415 [Xylaria intraflava]|nr:hypothetical protein F4861DRAFT_464415 [Xylaria intraflava]